MRIIESFLAIGLHIRRRQLRPRRHRFWILIPSKPRPALAATIGALLSEIIASGLALFEIQFLVAILIKLLEQLDLLSIRSKATPPARASGSARTPLTSRPAIGTWRR